MRALRITPLERAWTRRQPGFDLLFVGAVCGVLVSCDRASPSREALPSSVPSASLAAARASELVPAHDAQAEADCRSDTSPAPTAPGTPKTALRPEDRERLTTLRVSAHVGAVILRRQGARWVLSGPNGCTVPARRMERALDTLARLSATRSDERPADGNAFELQIAALIGEERALHFDVAGRDERGDLVQLLDASTVRIRGLDRDLWSPEPRAWCAP